MLKSKNMSKFFWAEAIVCVVYVLNMSPTRSFKGKTPYEIWSGQKPDIQHLRVFGCIAYVHVPNHLIKNLENCDDLYIN